MRVVIINSVMSGGLPKCDENTNVKFLPAAVCFVLDTRIRYMLPKWDKWHVHTGATPN